MSLLLLLGGGSPAEAIATDVIVPTLEVELSPGVWTDITADVIRDPIRWARGIFGSGPLDRLARPGMMSFTLDNTALNEAGVADRYTPGHANAVAGWRHGARVRLRLRRVAS